VASIPKTCVVIPAYREEGRIGPLIREVIALGHELLVVDDGSPDGTAREAEEAGARVIRHETNRGKGDAIRTGFAAAFAAGFEAALAMDADGQHDPAEAKKFIAAAADPEVAVVLGTRMTETAAMPFVRRWTNLLTSWVLSTISGAHMTDTQCGYRLVKKKAWEAVELREGRFNLESEFLVETCRQGLLVREVPIATIYHGTENSKVDPVLDTLRFFRLVARLARA